MPFDVLCLRPEADFARVGALPPASLKVSYGKPDDPALAQRIKASAALVIPAVGAKLPAALFEGCALALVQVTGAGVDRLDEAALTRLRIPVANVAGASNGAVAEYAVTSASMLLRRLAWASAEIGRRQLREFPRPHAGRQSGRARGPAGGRRRLRHHRHGGGARVPRHGLPHLLSTIRRRAISARRRRWARSRCRSPSCWPPPTW